MKEYKIINDEYVVFKLDDEIFAIDINTLGEIYQGEEEANIKAFLSEDISEIKSICYAFKVDSIFYNNKEDWDEFKRKIEKAYLFL